MLVGSAPRLVLPANARAADVVVDVDGRLVCVCTSNSTIHLARILTDRYFYYIYGIFFLANVMFPSPLDMMCGRYLWGIGTENLQFTYRKLLGMLFHYSFVL